MLTSSVRSSHGHASSKILELVDTLLDLVGRADDVNGLAVVRAWGQDDAAASLLEEVMERVAPLTDNELVSATLDGSLLDSQLLAELLSTTLKLGLDLLRGGTVTRDLDGEVGLGRKLSGLTASGLGRCLRLPSVVLGNLDVDIAALDKPFGMDIVGTSKEGVELGRDVLQTQVHGRGAFVDDGINLTTSHLSSQGIALNVNIDHSILILARLGLGDLNAGAGALADFLDLGTLTTDDVGTNGGRDGDIDGLLVVVSFGSIEMHRWLTLEPTSLATSLRACLTASTGPVASKMRAPWPCL